MVNRVTRTIEGVPDMLRHALLAGAVLIGIGAMAGSSQAATDLTGDSIEGSYDYPDATTAYATASYSVNPFTVGAGVESVLTVDNFATTNVDFSANQLVLTMTADVGYTSASFNGPEFSVLSGSGFGSVASVVTSGGQSVSASIVGGVLEVNWQGQSFNSGDTITISFGSGVVAAPELSTWAMMGVGFVGLGFAGFRSRREPAFAD